MAAEDRDVALARLRERYLQNTDAVALQALQREIVDAAEAERRDLQRAGAFPGRLLDVSPGLVRAVLVHEDERWRLDQDRDRHDVLHRPARILADEERVAVGDVDRH